MTGAYDILIVGGGLVGASLASALKQTTFKVALVEAVAPGDTNQPSYDDRTIALAWGSRRVYDALGVWPLIEQGAVCPIRSIHISDRGHFGITRLHAADAGLPDLGYVVENRALGRALYRDISSATNIDVYCPAGIDNIQNNTSDVSATVRVENGSPVDIRTRLLVVADGGRSGLREQLGFAASQKEYGQHAIVTNVSPGRDHQHVAYERFTSTGPLAMLPMQGNRCAMVWSARPEQVDTILSWSEEEFLHELQQRFGHRLGRFSRVGKRHVYPLSLTRVRQHWRDRIVLVGNAAHTVHPVAGQGFNLGLRDVATLAQVLAEAEQSGQDIGSPDTLSRYSDWRNRDNRVVSMFTDGLISVFSNSFFPVVTARNLGLLAVDVLPGLKRGFTRRTSGLNGKLPRLARGLSLSER